MSAGRVVAISGMELSDLPDGWVQLTPILAASHTACLIALDAWLKGENILTATVADPTS